MQQVSWPKIRSSNIIANIHWIIKKQERDFPGGPVAKTLCSLCRGLGSIPGKGTRSRMTQLRSHMTQQRPSSAKRKKKKSSKNKRKSKGILQNIYFCFTDYAKAFAWITTNCGEFLKRWEYQTTWPAFWQTCVQTRKQQLEPDMEQQTGSNLGKDASRLYIVILLI